MNDKTKTHKQGSIKVGRLKLTVARKINRKCADIYLTPNYLKHIEHRHKTELEKVGLSAIDFVKAIVKGYNQIRKGSGDSILLVIRKNSRTKKNPGHYKKKTSMGKVAHTFQRISAVRFLKHLRPFRRFA